MTTAAFDSHANIKELIATGMPEAQAEVLVRQQAQRNEEAATKKDLELAEHRLTIKFGAMVTAATGLIIATIALNGTAAS